ncbi:MAG: hypothetical protein ACC682_06005 [Gemmatimonadota bacterium]
MRLVPRGRVLRLVTFGLAAGLGGVMAARLSAQTSAAIGLGYPVPPIDARAVGIGGTGLGLIGSSFSLINPADMRQHENPGFGLAFAAEGTSVNGLENPLESGRHRFNLVRAVAPFGDWAFGIAFGGVFDQDWSVRFLDSLVLEDGVVPFEETREHDGGISTIDLSAARSLGPLAVGFTAQRFTGSLRQTFNRTFDAPRGRAPSLGAAGGTQTLAYEGWRFRGGLAFELSDRVMLSGAVSLKSTLRAIPDGDKEALGEVQFPTTFDLGGSVKPFPQLMLAGSVGWGAWSSVGDLGDARSHDIVQFGGGLEYDGLRLIGGQFPLRFGYRRADLPFSNGDVPITERALTWGLGWVFRQGVAEVNVGFDFGTRTNFAREGVEESFRRMTVSFALRQLPRF